MESLKKKTLLLTAVFTFCVILTSALLVRHFVHLNYEYIVNPEISPGYSDNTPFGDGGDVWREKGIYLPTALLVFLVVFNGIGISMHFCDSLRKLHVFLIVSVGAIFVIVTELLLDNTLLYGLFTLVSFLFELPEFLLVPVGVVCTIVFLVQKKTLLLAGHVALLSLSMAASCAMALFSNYLYLD